MSHACLVAGTRTPIGRYGGALPPVRPDDAEHVNPHGGAIALGHPLGASGARLALTAAHEMADRGVRRALCSMCVGSARASPCCSSPLIHVRPTASGGSRAGLDA